MQRTEVAPVSVVIPCYLCKMTIDRAVNSVWNQTLKPFEVILIEDCSPDAGKTLNELYAIQKKYPEEWVKVLSLSSNQGPGNARNKGWEMASQKYVAFLDSDDTWHPRKIEIQYKEMSADSDVVLSGHPFRVATENDQNDFPINHDITVDWVKPSQMLMKNLFSTPSVMLHRDIPYRFDTNKNYSEDYQLWLEILLETNRVKNINVPLANIHKAPFGAGGLSGKIWAMEKGEINTYLYLNKKRLISKSRLGFLLPFSLAKFFIRWLKTKVR